VTVTIKNLTRKTSFTKNLTMAAPDVSSAEWIAEAPSASDTYGRCRQVALTNFGSVSFSKALATAARHTGTIADSVWSTTPLELQSSAGFGPLAAADSGALAVPGRADHRRKQLHRLLPRVATGEGVLARRLTPSRTVGEADNTPILSLEAVATAPAIGRAVPASAGAAAEATRDLYERFSRQIFAYCLVQLRNREEAEDAVQTTFLNAFRALERGVVPELESAWLYKIAQHVCLTRRRSWSRRRLVESPQDLAAFGEADKCLRQAVAEMEAQRDEELARVDLATPCRKVLESLQAHWEGLTRFVNDPRIPMDNNASERRARGPAVARKNFYGSGSLWSGQLTAAAFSIFATLSLWQLNPRRWLTWYFEHCAMAGGKVPEDIEPFLPWNLDAGKRSELGEHGLAEGDDTS
jgi:transposase